MTYRFIRTGPNPVNSGNYPAWQIRACFEFCTNEVKRQLEEFLNSKAESVTFNFDDSRVTIWREE